MWRRAWTLFEIENRAKYMSIEETHEVSFHLRNHNIYYMSDILHQNRNYTDMNGNYKLISREHVFFRYEIKEILGTGSFSSVARAYDHKCKEEVAIKAFVQNSNLKMFENETYCLNYLKNLPDYHDLPFVQLKNHFLFRGHFFIVLELSGTDLYKELMDKYPGFNLHEVKKIIHILLRGLAEMKKIGLIHGDLKPSNLVYKNKDLTTLKIIDFGLAEFEWKEREYHPGTRLYSAPEQILRKPFGIEVDMWAVGCIIVHLCTGRPLFISSDDEHHMSLIKKFLDIPENGCFSVEENIYNRHFIVHMPSQESVWECLNGNGNEYLVDFVQLCFVWSPLYRLTPDRGLQHPWISSLQETGTKTLLKRSYPIKHSYKFIGTCIYRFFASCIFFLLVFYLSRFTYNLFMS